MSCINNVPVKGSDREGLLNKFPEKYRDKLKVYTGEELYYIYKLAIFKPRIGKDKLLLSSGDGFFLGLKAKLFRWLKEPMPVTVYREDGSAYPVNAYRNGIHPSVWIKLGSKYRNQFNEFVIDSITQDMIDNLTKSVNAKRVS